MSLRLRRGTDAERQAVTFLEGELVYTTDTKKVFVGDGSTLGGVAIDSALGSIGTLTDVDISGVAIGQVLQWDGARFVPGSADKESVYGNDSTILVDTISSAINLDGTVKGNIVPDANIAYDLGSASNRFRDLYLSGTSIDLGGTTISIAGGKVNFGAPVQAEFELNQNMDIKNYYITSTDATPNISIRPGTNADFHVATVAGAKKFEVDLDTNTYGTPSGEKSVLQLPVFASSDYTAHGSDESMGQLVFDDPSKTLKVYNGSAWVTVQGSGGGGGGIAEGQLYNIDIEGNIIGSDSTVLLDSNTGQYKGDVVSEDGTLLVDNALKTIRGDFQGNLFGNVVADDSSIMVNTALKKFVGVFDGELNGSVNSDDSGVLLDAVSGESRISKTIVTGSILTKSSLDHRLISTSGNIKVGGDDENGSHVNNSLIFDREGTSPSVIISQNFTNGTNRSTDLKTTKYRGTVDSPAAAQSGDIMMELVGEAYDGSNMRAGVAIEAISTAAPGASFTPTRLLTRVGDDAGTGLHSYQMGSDGVFTAPTFKGGIQTISGPGAIDIVNLTTEITTTGADAFTLADGTSGQIKIIILATDGGDATITPTTFANGTTITMDDQHESVMLQYGANGWVVIASQNAVVA